MATVTFDWRTTVFSTIVNTSYWAGNQVLPSLAHFGDGTFLATWSDQGSQPSVQGRRINPDNVGSTTEFTVNTVGPGTQVDSDAASWTGNRVLVAYTDLGTDPGGDIRLQVVGSGGAINLPDLGVSTSASDDTEATVTGLSDGGVAVAWVRTFGGGDLDIRASVYNSDLSVRQAQMSVDIASDRGSLWPSIAGLAGPNAGFVVVWLDYDLDNTSDSEIAMRRYAADGTPLGGRQVVDSSAPTYGPPKVAALNDGGFVVVTHDNGWTSGYDITAKFFNADGSVRRSATRVNDLDLTAGDQFNPVVTVMENGFVVVGWTSGLVSAYIQVFTPDGNRIGDNEQRYSNYTSEMDLAALDSGYVADLRNSTLEESSGSGSSQRMSVDELFRTIVSTEAGEAFTGDALRDVFRGNGGNDLFNGLGGNDDGNAGSGNDTVTLGDGDDRMYGWTGNDSIFGGSGVDALIGDAGTDTLDGGSENDRLFGGSGDDELVGGSGADFIDGSGGNDNITGGSGNDRLQGRTGADDYYFATGSGADRIFGFEDNIDTLFIDDAYGFANAAAVVAATSVSGQNLFINLGGGNSINLWLAAANGITPGELQNDISLF